MKGKQILFCIGALLTGIGSGAFAQTSTPATVNSAERPKAIGTSQQVADEARRKAEPRSDVGTVVRTAPSAAEKTAETALPSNDVKSSKARHKATKRRTHLEKTNP